MNDIHHCGYKYQRTATRQSSASRSHRESTRSEESIKRSFLGVTYDGRYALYWQADQILFREPGKAPGSLGKSSFDGKVRRAGNEVKEAVQMAPRLADQGSFFQLRAQIQQRGAFLFSHRPVYGYGNYSYYKILSENDRGVSVHQTYDAVLEFDYRLQLRTCSRLFSILSALMPPAWWRMPRSWVSRGERRFRSTARRSHRAWASQSLPPSRSARPNAQARRWRARFWCSMENRSSSGCSWRSRQRARKWARERY